MRGEKRPGPFVIKLGGSLWSGPELRRWLACVVGLPGEPRLAVPGGGPFADAVRAAQPRLGYDDRAAHRMAILAMQQYGLALLSLEPRLAACESLPELRSARVGLWLPWALAGDAPDLAPSWATTSDTIACWLATRLEARALLLVKSVRPDASTLTARALAERKIVDEAFPAMAAAFGGPVGVLHRSEPEALAEILRTGEPGRYRLDPA